MIESFLSWCEGLSWELGSIVVFIASLTEYLFPPFPGDAVTLTAAALVPVADWPLSAIYLSTVLGSTSGAMVTFQIGRWIERHPSRDTWIHRLLSRPSIHRRIERATRRFEKHGVWFLILNRFVPALRAVFFIAAGMARLSHLKVGLCAFLSAAIFNGIIFGLGFGIGVHMDTLTTWLNTYSAFGLVLVGICLMAWWFWPKTPNEPTA